jgi:ornithine cyclodeaminase/alanine dehydrogenase-like protein (mu-crystallin family)
MVPVKLSTLLLGEDELRRIARVVGIDALMDETIVELERALARFDPDRVDVRKREGFAYRLPVSGALEWMPVMEVGREAVIKIVGYHPRNVSSECPTIVSSMSLYDVRTGHLRALADGAFPTALRTGAASAIASKILAREDSTTIGLVGCGAQAVTQLHALSRVFKIDRVLVHDTAQEALASFARRVAFLGLGVSIASLSEVERGADILCTATSVDAGAGPVIGGTELKPHVHVNAVGSDLPGKAELPSSFLRRAFVCPDFLPQALVEGECQQLGLEEIGPTLAEVVKNPSLGHLHRDRPTVFDSTGFALEDQVVFGVLLRHAERIGVGRLLRVETSADDPRDPYGFVAQAAPAGE